MIARQIANIPPEIVTLGWGYLGAIADLDPASRLLDLGYQRVDESEPCGDAIMRLPSGNCVIIREDFSMGQPGMYALYRVGFDADPMQLAEELMAGLEISADKLISIAEPGNDQHRSRRVGDYEYRQPTAELREQLRPRVLHPQLTPVPGRGRWRSGSC